MEEILETTNIEEAAEEEKNLLPGSYEVRFYITEPVSSDDMKAMTEHLSENGVTGARISQIKTDGLWAVSVKYNKPDIADTDTISFLPVAVIPLIAFGFVAVLVGIGIFKIQDVANNIGKILLITFGGMTLFALALRKPIEQVSTAYVSRR